MDVPDWYDVRKPPIPGEMRNVQVLPDPNEGFRLFAAAGKRDGRESFDVCAVVVPKLSTTAAEGLLDA